MTEAVIQPVKFNETPHRDHALLNAALAYVLASVTAKCDGRKFALDDPERYFPQGTIGIRYVQRVASVKLDEFRAMLREVWRLQLDPWAAKARWDAESSRVVLWLEHADGSRWPRA